MARNGNKQTGDMVKAIDRMRRLEEFEATVLPQVREDLRKGLTADQIYEKYENMAAARAVSIALLDPDSSKAIAAIKDIRDRKSGKATEKREVIHRMARLPDEQLDALLLTELEDLEDNKKKP